MQPMVLASIFNYGKMVKLITDYGGYFVEGLKYTLILSAMTVIAGSLLGFILYVIKASQLRIGGIIIKNNPEIKKNKALYAVLSFKPFSFLGTLYIELVRGTPLLLQLYIAYFIVPALLGADISKFTSVAVALALNSCAYVAEIIRSGIQAVDKGQDEAARSLGFSSGESMLYIVLPQAVRNILPSIGNEFVMVIKETSLASTFFVGDLMTQYKVVQAATYTAMEPLVIIAIIYFITTFSLSKVMGQVERRMAASD